MAAFDWFRPLSIAAGALCVGCTLTGLGNYTTEACPDPVGKTLVAHAVGNLQDVTFASLDGSTPIAAFVSNSCVQGVAEGAGADWTLQPLQQNCTLLASLTAEQPMVVQSGGALAAVTIATTVPCLTGRLSFESITGSGASALAQATCATGAALPSVYPLTLSGASDLVAWYETPYKTRSDPIQSCSGAQPASLVVALASRVSSTSPSLGKPATLTSQSISVRPAAMTSLGSSQVLVAAPDAGAVSVWATSDGQTFVDHKSIAGLANARAVSIATDGSQRIAVVAELGCAPQAIAIAVGTLSSGFGAVTTVVSKSNAAIVEPSVAWVPAEHDWIVGWIQAGGGGRALAKRLDADGKATGGLIDPSSKATAAIVESDATLLAYEPNSSGGSVVKRGLGCGP